MIFLNPQWQGAGDMREIEKGAHVLSDFLNKADIVEIPLSSRPCDTIHNIRAYQPICEQLADFRKLVARQLPEKISTIGGDCGIEVVPVSYLNMQYNDELTVAWFDGHADLNSAEDSPSKHFHGMPVRILLGEGDKEILRKAFSVLRPEQFVFIGVNDMDPAEENYINEHSIEMIGFPDFDLIHKTIDDKNKRNIYIHFDLDVLTEKEFNCTPYPNKTGFKVADALKIIRGLKKKFNVVGSSVTESTADHFAKLQPVEQLVKELIN